jgi:nicotinamide phosphoribosyltransferase
VDFGYRGCSSEEQAGIGGLAHLVSFSATDTIAAIVLGKEFYDSGVCGFSIPATEHSVMVAKGKGGELEQCKRFLEQYPDGLVACVSDTYDIFNCCENIWGGELKDIVENRNGTLVIRPDSGDFFEVVPSLLNILSNKFEFYVNAKGYRVLNDKVRLIQGDGMNPRTMDRLYEKIIELGWSADNLTVGSGGGLLIEGLTRDTHKFAIKASWAEIDGKSVELFKSPITDSGKSSKAGRLKLVKEIRKDGASKYKTFTSSHPLFHDFKDELVEVFRDGKLLIDQTFAEIRARADQF